MKKLFYISILFLFSVVSNAQVDTAGTVFVTNDFKGGSENVISIKWLALKVYYPEGFNVYRQEKGNSNWEKLNEKPIKVASEVPADYARKDPDLKTFLDNVNQVSYADFQKGIMRLFVAIKAIKSSVFAELLGVVYYDETVNKGSQYRYQVKGIDNGKEFLINTTGNISPGPYKPTSAPQDITINRKKKVIEINWKYEDERYYGVNIYRSTNGKPYEKITPQERHIQKTPGKKGTFELPEIFFEDLDIKKDEAYTYKLTSIDYFGQESGFSPEVKMEIKDFDPPPAVTSLKGEVKLTDVKLTWGPQLVDDLKGFNVYRHHHAVDGKVKLNETLLDRVANNFDDQVLETGIYYYSVGAVDNAGNEGMSGEIMVDVHDVFPPGIPQNVHIKADSGKFSLDWDHVQDGDLAGYFVYRSLSDDNNEDNEFIVMNTEPIKENTYIDKLPKNVRNKFVYTVVAMDTSYNHSGHSEISVVRLPDVTPPQAPFIRNIHTEPGKIRIDWLPNHETDIKVYQVYRSSSVDSANYILLGQTLPSSSASFEDQTPHPGVTYYYYLKAVDQSDNVSTISNIYEGLVFDDSDSYVEKELKGLLVSEVKTKYNKKKKQIELSWKNVDSPEFLGLVIYRGTTVNDLEPLTGLQKVTSYTDKSLKGSSQFVYQFRSYDVNGHKVASTNYTVKTVK